MTTGAAGLSLVHLPKVDQTQSHDEQYGDRQFEHRERSEDDFFDPVDCVDNRITLRPRR
jgi:hypothetical protein